MKKETHPDYMVCEVECGCGERFVTRSTQPEIKVEVCSKCHPFYTGEQKLMDSTGRLETFQRKWGKHIEEKKAGLVGGNEDKSGEPSAEQ